MADTKTCIAENAPRLPARLPAARWAFMGAGALWLAFPPLGLWPLLLVAVGAWTRLTEPTEQIDRRGWRAIWFASLLYWLGMNYFVTLPHWAGSLGWLAMSGYLALFLPLFVYFARSLRQCGCWPAAVACPLAWVAMEWLRAHLISGYGMAMLSHALFRQPLWIQTADLFGSYGVSAGMVAVAACLEQARQARRLQPLAIAVLLLIAAGGYGVWRQQYQPADDRSCVVALIQGSRDVVFGLSPEAEAVEALIKFREYRDLTVSARAQWPDCQLIAWPEGMFPAVDYLPVADLAAPRSVSPADLAAGHEEFRLTWQAAIGMIALRDDPPESRLFSAPIPLLAGTSSVQFPERHVYNSSVLIDTQGQIVSRYFKMHLVMFGEYVPLGNWFPWVYRLTPIPGGLEAGHRPENFTVCGIHFTPSICFESTVSRLIRRHVIWQRPTAEPDCLVNLTNDGWFYGSSCLDQHLACNVFRAVELRKPVVVAANTGFSAHINGSGQILNQGPRRQTATLRAVVVPDGRRSLYSVLGEWPALVVTLFTATISLARWRSVRKANQE